MSLTSTSTNAPTVEWAPAGPYRTKSESWTSVTPLSVVKHFRLREIGGLPKFTNDRSATGVIRLLVKSRAPVLIAKEEGEEEPRKSATAASKDDNVNPPPNEENDSDDYEEEEGEEVENEPPVTSSSSSTCATPVEIKIRKIGRSGGIRARKPKYKFTYLQLRSLNSNNPANIMFVEDDVLILTAKGSRMEIHMTEVSCWLSKALTKRYAVWGEYNKEESLRKASVRDVKVDAIYAIEMKGDEISQLRYLLVTLSQSKLTTYDLQTGKFVDSIDLKKMGGQASLADDIYDWKGFDCFSDTFMGPCIKVERKRGKEKFSDFLLLSVMPLSVKYWFKIDWKRLGITKSECLDADLFYFMNYSKLSCLADIGDVIYDNQKTSTESASSDPQFKGMKTVEVNIKPTPLLSMKMQLSSINCWTTPPCVLGNACGGDLVIYNLDKPELPMHRIDTMSVFGRELEPVLSTYTSCSDVLLSGVDHGFSIFELRNGSIKTETKGIDSMENVLVCEEVFSTKSLFCLTNEEMSDYSRRTSSRSLRPLQRKVYTSAEESEKLYFFEYDYVLNLFVALEIDIRMKCMALSLFDKETKKLVMKLKPFSIKKHTCARSGISICPVKSKVIINFAFHYISVNINYLSNRGVAHSSYVYFVNLLGECVQDDLYQAAESDAT